MQVVVNRGGRVWNEKNDPLLLLWLHKLNWKGQFPDDRWRLNISFQNIHRSARDVTWFQTIFSRHTKLDHGNLINPRVFEKNNVKSIKNVFSPFSCLLLLLAKSLKISFSFRVLSESTRTARKQKSPETWDERFVFSRRPFSFYVIQQREEKVNSIDSWEKIFSNDFKLRKIATSLHEDGFTIVETFVYCVTCRTRSAFTTRESRKVFWFVMRGMAEKGLVW